MAQKLYKWTGILTSPDSYDSEIPAPKWYGTDENGVGYGFLDTTFAANVHQAIMTLRPQPHQPPRLG